MNTRPVNFEPQQDESKKEIHDLGEHIYQFENCVPKQLCEDAIRIFDEASEAGMTMDRLDNMGASALNINDEAIVHQTIPPSSLPVVRPIVDIVNNEVMPEFLRKYPIEAQYNWIGVGGAKMQRTEPTQGYHNWHMEHSNQLDSYRSILAWGIFLNDVEEGGELEFLYQSVRVKPRQGDLILWPSGFTHQHRGNPPLKGTKYIYTGWIDTI